MKQFFILIAFVALSLFAPSLKSADTRKLPTTQETDKRLHADGKGWKLYKADITDAKRPRVLLIGDSILGGYGKLVAASLEGKAFGDAWMNAWAQSECRSTVRAGVMAQGP